MRGFAMASTVETNIKLFPQRKSLYVWVREAPLSGPHLSEENAEKVCVKLASEHGLAAVVKPDSESARLLVATKHAGYELPQMNIEVSELSFTLQDTNKPTEKITLASPHGEHILPLLLERAMAIKLMRSEFWSFDSTRLWYEPQPFNNAEEIDAYRRYKIGAISLDEEGVGIVVDVQTAFFSTQSLAWFFDRGVERGEQEHRRQLFERLSLRQEDQKGTLLYTIGHKQLKCYFVEAPGRTCNETGAFAVQGTKYQNLTHYYHEVYPALDFDPQGEAILVSFKGLDGKPKWVAAELLRIRVMNDVLPREFRSLGIPPDDRRHLISQFWDKLGDYPFAGVAPRPEVDFWRPDSDKVTQLSIPTLCFGKSALLPAPEQQTEEAYRDHYAKRIEYLDELGCWQIAHDMPRTLHFAYPSSVDLTMVERFASAITQRISSWTKKDINFAPPISYHSIHDAKQQLQQHSDGGMLVLVLDDEPSNYYEAAYQLDRWRIKRLTPHSLSRHHAGLTKGWFDRRSRVYDKRRGGERWDNYIALNALDILQLLDVYPYVYEGTQGYEAQLFIDVGHTRRDFVITLLIARDNAKRPSFDIASMTVPKQDPKRESINSRVLVDSIEQLISNRLWRRFDPLESLLAQRDGRFCGDEARAVLDAVDRLKPYRISKNATVDLIDLRKTSQNSMRLWEIDSYGNVKNPLEGTALRLNTKTLMIASTGRATLHQGTAAPFVLVGSDLSNDIDQAGYAVFASTQLNWSSPQVAQRLPIHVKNSDEALQDRAAQLVRGFR
jgi:hypothetical protein